MTIETWRVAEKEERAISMYDTVGTVFIDHVADNHEQKIEIHGDNRHELAHAIVEFLKAREATHED